MKRSLVTLVVFALAGSVSAFAATDMLRISSPFVLNGVQLQPGDYRVAVSPTLDSVQLVRGKKIATAPCKVSLADPSIARDEVHSRPDAAGHEAITRLVLAHAHMSVEILDGAPVAAGSAAGADGTR